MFDSETITKTEFIKICYVSVSDNNLSEESVRKITEVIPKLANITSVM